jgi:hypothetical protein
VQDWSTERSLFDAHQRAADRAADDISADRRCVMSLRRPQTPIASASAASVGFQFGAL